MLLCDGHGIAHPRRFGLQPLLVFSLIYHRSALRSRCLSGPMARCLKNVELGSRCDTEGSALVLQYELA